MDSQHSLLDSRLTPAQIEAHVQNAALTWHGGIVTAPSGEQLRIYISDSLTPEQASAQLWADFFAKLLHGNEFSILTVWITTISEIHEICGADAGGCYDFDREYLYMPGDTEESAIVAVHEYAHHIEHNRPNPPWRAEDYGPKRWATEQNICTRATAGNVFPGDEGERYILNPAEGFAEVYRALNALKAGASSFTWPIVDWSFYPDAAALAAAEADVVSPWLEPTQTNAQRRLTKKIRTWVLPVQTPLDGTLEVDATIGRVIPFELSLLDGDRRHVVTRGVWAGPKERKLRYTICGERAFTVRVAAGRALGPVTIRLSTP